MADDEETWDDLEAALIQADIGVEIATRLTEAARGVARRSRCRQPCEGAGSRTSSTERSTTNRTARCCSRPTAPTVWLVVGVNGTGKTTTIGKLAHDLTERGRSVALAAADTFRAAADEQLGVWAERSGAELVKHQHGADPGAVAYDASNMPEPARLDVLIVDTAGRLHTKTPLMDELAKVRRVIEKEGRVDEVLLVIDATAGQNGLVQAKEFAEAAGVTGIVLTKLDGTAKGGIAVAIENDLGIPIKLIGVGEGIDDLEPFDPKTFVDALLVVKVVVAGGTGFLGRYITRALLDDGHEVTVLSRRADVTGIPQLVGANATRADVTQPETLTGKLDRSRCGR